MFYPVNSLKKGGRFYLCWVADSWPLRFATLTHRQLWSQDIRQICDDLLQVMWNESGRPTNRFSLRLSSQLMRGLVRLYHKKVTIFLSELCMMNAYVMKHTNKKWTVHEVFNIPAELAPEHPQPVVQEILPEHEERVEEMIQNSNNVVINVQDITMKEAAIPDFQLTPSDNFGEENPDLNFQLLADKTMEQMLVPGDVSAIHHSGLDVPALDVTEKSHDKSRLVQQDIQMERISEHDVTLFRKSTGEEQTSKDGFDKEIPRTPELPLPDLPLPELPAPPAEEEQVQEESVPVPGPSGDIEPQEVSKEEEIEEIELEELDEKAPPAKKFKKIKSIIDKKIIISGNVFRQRVQNPNVELRCEDSSDDIVNLRVHSNIYLRRPAHCGAILRHNFSQKLSVLFTRNLGVINQKPLAEREMEEALTDRSRRQQITILETIEEEPTVIQETSHLGVFQPIDVNVEPRNISDIQFNVPEQMIMSEMPIQLLESQTSRKRTAEYESPSKRRRHGGYVSIRTPQKWAAEAEADKENIPIMERQEVIPVTERIEPEPITEHPKDTDRNLIIPVTERIEPEPITERPKDTDRNLIIPVTERIEPEPITEHPKGSDKNLSLLLQEAGLADIQANIPAETIQEHVPADVTRKRSSEASETPLGSLDRTKVSLGNSDKTTDSARFIRNEWGVEGTMLKILYHIKNGMVPLTVESLVRNGPIISGHQRIIAARCFTSILKLKQNDFIRVKKNPDTLEIVDILIGSKFD